MNKRSFFVFISLVLVIAVGYLYLEYFKGGANQSIPETGQNQKPIRSGLDSLWEKQRVQLSASDNQFYTFELPAQWQAAIATFSPPGSPSVNQGYRIDLLNAENSLKYTWYSPLKFHFYLGELGTYLSRQRAPMTTVELLQSFFGHHPDSCLRIDAPSKNWNGGKSQPVEHYSEVLTDWYKIHGLAQPTYYYIKIEKAPTPGVYGDLGSWTFSGFRFELPVGEKLSEKHIEPAQTFYRSVEQEKAPDSKS